MQKDEMQNSHSSFSAHHSTFIPPLPLPSPEGRASMIVALIKLILFLIVLGFVAWALAEQFRRVTWEEVHFRPVPLLGAIVAAMGISMTQLLMFRTLLSAYG